MPNPIDMRSSSIRFSAFCVLSALFLVPVLLYGQSNVVPFKSGNPSPEADGIIYSLPRNLVRIELLVTKTESFKGPYAEFAKKYLGINTVINDNATVYTVEDAFISVLAETDPDQYYFVEIGEKSKKSQSMFIGLNEQGYISSFAGIADRHRNTGAGKQGTLPPSSGNSPFIDLLQPSMLERVDTIVRRISVDTTTIEEIFVRKSVSEKTTDQMAREAAELIRKIDDNKFSLITGYQEVNYSKDALKFMIGELEKTKKEYLALFTGKSRKSVSSHVFYVTPGTNPDGMLETLCRFSRLEGILPRTAAGGESVSISVFPLNQIGSIRSFVEGRDIPGKKKRGFYYRIPEKAGIRLTVGNKTLAEQNAMISQLGVVTFLPSAVFSKVKFNTLTGGIEAVVTE